MAFNPSINEDIRDCYFIVVLLKFWLSIISTRKSVASQQVNLGFVLEEKVTAAFVPKPDNRAEFGLGSHMNYLGQA